MYPFASDQHVTAVELSRLDNHHEPALYRAMTDLPSGPHEPWWASNMQEDMADRLIARALQDREGARGDTFAIHPRLKSVSRVLGCAELREIDWIHGAATASLWLSGSVRRQGLGRAAFTQLWGIARARGITRLELTMASGNLPALALAKSVNAVEEGRLVNRFLVDGRREDAVLMAVCTCK